jgi:hypothetical protein
VWGHSSVYLGTNSHHLLLIVLHFQHSIWKKLERNAWYCAGGYEKEDRAARAYDIAALKYWGANAIINFPVSVTLS